MSGSNNHLSCNNYLFSSVYFTLILTYQICGKLLKAAVLRPERVNCYSPTFYFLWDRIVQCFRPDSERCPKPKSKPNPAGSGLMRCDGCQTSPRLRSSRSTLYARGSAPAHCGTDSAYGAKRTAGHVYKTSSL